MATQPDHWETIKKLFEAALEEDPAHRSSFLQEQCPDLSLRGEVERLLAEHDQAGTFLSTPALGNFSLETESRSQALSVGEVLAGRFRILHFIAGGGMGEVYEAEDQELRDRVAVKTIRHEILAQPNAVARFKREVHLARKVTHSNVCRIFDIFRHKPEQVGVPETVFISMELLHGKTLGARLKEGRMSEEEALPLVRQMASALAAAHAVGIVHRDFKPGNVVLVDVPGRARARAVVTDFGLALQSLETGEGFSISTGLGLLGTPAYMAPEQLEGRPATAASDIYALGLVMYEMVTGARPFQGDTPMSAAMKRLSQAPVRPRKVEPGLSPAWESAILRCLERDPAKRFANAEEIAFALGGTDSGTTSKALQLPHGNRRTWIALIAIVLLAALAAGYGVWRWRVPSDKSSTQVNARPSVAVLGFKNLSGKPDLAWISTALSEELSSELAAGEKLRTVPGENVAHMKNDLTLPDADSLGKETLAKIHGRLGSDLVVLGSYLEVGQQLRVDLRVQDTKIGETVATIHDTTSESEILDLVSRVGEILRTKCGGGEITADQQAAVKAAQPSSAEAAQLYAEGLEKLRTSDALGARDLLQRAVIADPNHALAHSALARVWERLGYDKKAKEDGEQALRLSSSLSREDRLSIEGSYYSAARDWAKATEVYRTLFTFFPDNLEYGLDLASAQYQGPNPKDAQATLIMLRRLPPPAGEDARIDLVEARMYGALGNYKASLPPANAVSAKAQAMGARLLMADGRRAQAWALMNMGELKEALPAMQEAREMYRNAGDRAGEGRAAGGIGLILSNQGELTKAEMPYRESLAILQDIGDRRSTANTMMDLANLISDQGHFHQAKAQYEAALAIYEEIEDSQRVAAARGNLAILLYQQGKYKEAKSQFEESIALNRSLGISGALQRALTNYGELLYRSGELNSSRAAYEEGLNLANKIGYKRGVAIDTLGLGNILLARNEIPQAQKSADEVLRLGNDLGDKVRIARAKLFAAEIMIALGKGAEAEQLAREALAQISKEDADDPTTNGTLALSLLTQNRAADAQAAVLQAKRGAEKGEDPVIRWSTEVISARVTAANGHSKEAIAELRHLVSEAGKSGDRVCEFQARLALGEIEMAAGLSGSGRARLATLEKGATEKGFLLIASKAKSARKVEMSPWDLRSTPSPK